MSFAPYEQELTTAINLAKQAANVVMQHYNNSATLQVEYKDAAATDPVTAADKDANTIIVDGLAATFPQDAILAEESIDDKSRLSCERLWCVDPVDGTREFVAHNGQFVVMIGLAIAGRSVLGVVLQPTTNTLWYGIAPHNNLPGYAFKEQLNTQNVNNTPTRIRVSNNAQPSHAQLMISRSHRSKTLIDIAQQLQIAGTIPRGSVGLKMAGLCGTVSGSGSGEAPAEADLYISLTDRTKEWDSCGPEAILRGAGGEMTGVTGTPLIYNKEHPNNPRGILASNMLLHDIATQALIPFAKQKDWD